MPRDTATRQVERDLVIAVLAVVSVAIGVYEVLNPRTRPGFTLLDAVDLGIVLVFIVDFVVHARASGDWRRYVRRHWWEVPSLIPLTGGVIEGTEGFSLVRGVRLVRLARVVRLLRVIGVAARFRRVRRYVVRVARRANVFAIALFASAVILTGTVIAMIVEVPANPEVSTFWGALWWCLNIFVAITSVPFQPVTAAGHVLAAALGILGIGFIGLYTASLASAILTEPGADEDTEDEEPPLD